MIPESYGEFVVIPFKASLDCGPCIRAWNIYCIPGAEGSDPSTWGTTYPVCCEDEDNCPALSNNTYTCSANNRSIALALALCPSEKKSCGNSTAFGFDAIGEKQSINIALVQGETWFRLPVASPHSSQMIQLGLTSRLSTTMMTIFLIPLTQPNPSRYLLLPTIPPVLSPPTAPMALCQAKVDNRGVKLTTSLLKLTLVFNRDLLCLLKPLKF